MRLLKVNEELSRISFWMLLAGGGWKRGCQPFSCPWSENVTYCRKDICSTRFPPLLLGNAKHPLPTRSLLCILVASCPSLGCSYTKKRLSCRGAKGLVTELSCPRFVMSDTVIVSKTSGTGYWLRSQLWHVTAAKPMNSCRDWAFSNSGPAFQLPMFSKCHALPKGDWFDMFVYQESFPAIPFGISKHPLSTRSLRFLRATIHSTSSAICLHHAHPFVAASEKKRLSHAEKQSVRSNSCGQMYNTVIVSKTWSTGDWLSSQLCYVTAAKEWTVFEIELLATVGWKWGCQPFSCPCSQKMTGCRKEICSTYLLKVSIADIPLRNAKHPLCSRSLRLLRAAVRSTSSALCLHFAFTMLAKDPGPLSKIPDLCFMQRSTGFGHRVVVSKICYNAVIVLSVVLWDCCRPMNTRRDWAFSNSGLEVGLPAFQLPMFTKRIPSTT